MILKGLCPLFVAASLTSFLQPALAWPGAASFSAHAQRDVNAETGAVYAEAPPGPLEFDGTKLVNDAAHPWQRLRPGDVRGPCPALNTLASHGVRLHSFALLKSTNCLIYHSTYLAMA